MVMILASTEPKSENIPECDDRGCDGEMCCDMYIRGMREALLADYVSKNDPKSLVETNPQPSARKPGEQNAPLR